MAVEAVPDPAQILAVETAIGECAVKLVDAFAPGADPDEIRPLMIDVVRTELGMCAGDISGLFNACERWAA